jgi:hypothetical protein
LSHFGPTTETQAPNNARAQQLCCSLDILTPYYANNDIDPVPFKHLTSDLLAAAILKALAPEALEKAKKLGEIIAKENGAEEGAKSFHDMLDVKKYRCLAAPSRVAVCRIRKTNIRLSSLAAIVLGDEGLIKSSDLKL